MSELNTVVHFSPVRFYFTMMVLNFIFIVHPTNASVEFLQLNPAHNDDKYVPGRRQVRILEDRKLLVIWQLCGDIIQSSQSWLWPSTIQWSKQGLMWPERNKTKSPPTLDVKQLSYLSGPPWGHQDGQGGLEKQEGEEENFLEEIPQNYNHDFRIRLQLFLPGEEEFQLCY